MSDEINNQIAIINQLGIKEGEIIRTVSGVDSRSRQYASNPIGVQNGSIGKMFVNAMTAKPVIGIAIDNIKINTARHFNKTLEKVHPSIAVTWFDLRYQLIKEWATNHKANMSDIKSHFGDSIKALTFIKIAQDAVNVIENGASSNVFIASDGSSNGIQHWATLSHNRIIATAVNITALGKSATGKDIYSDVVNAFDTSEVTPAIKKILDSSTRSDTKGDCIVFVYGGSRRSFEANTIADYGQRIKDSGVDFKEAVKVITSVKVKAMDEVLEPIKKVMNFVRAVDRAVTTHRVKDESGKVVSVLSGHKTTSTVDGFKFTNDKTQINSNIRSFDAKGANAAISPSFVHQRDASHMTRVINACAAENIHVEGIHDSFSTVAADYTRMQEIIREQWADLYRPEINHIGNFIKENKSRIQPAKYRELAIKAVVLYSYEELTNKEAKDIVIRLGEDRAIASGFRNESLAVEAINNPYGFM